ncbi:MAG: 50S ribosomal protein L18 [Fimbriimonadaceae bacterium]
MATKTRAQQRIARHVRLRKRLAGTSERPRLAVYRSLRHISAQIIDDSTGTTVAAASTMEKAIGGAGNVAGARAVGQAIAKRAIEKGVKSVVFDRGGFRYQGTVAALADGAREAGLEF